MPYAARSRLYTLAVLPDDRSDLLRLLSDAFAQGSIQPIFQPILALQEQAVAGFEILPRWHHPDHGELSSVAFLQHLDRHGLLDDLAGPLLTAALADAKHSEGDFFVAYNLSASQLERSGYADRMAAIAADTGFPLERIHLEISECVVAKANARVFASLREFAAAGIRLGIDDYGAAYSKLAHSNLTQLPEFHFDALKVDSELVRDLDTSLRKRHIFEHLMHIASARGMRLIANGVETVGQESALRKLGCRFVQGLRYLAGESAQSHRVAWGLG